MFVNTTIIFSFDINIGYSLGLIKSFATKTNQTKCSMFYMVIDCSLNNRIRSQPASGKYCAFVSDWMDVQRFTKHCLMLVLLVHGSYLIHESNQIGS